MRVSDRFGYRGACLLILGTMWALFGLSIFLDPPVTHSLVLHEMLPAWMRGTAWIASGAAAVVCGLRGPRGDDTIGMTALMVMPMVRLLSFAASWLIYVALTAVHWADPSVNVAGYERGWYSASVWALIVTLLGIVAGWPNPRHVLPIPKENAR